MSAQPSGLPVSAVLAWWGTAWLRGEAAADDLLDAVIGEDAAHTVGGLEAEPVSLLAAMAQLRARGATGVGAAFPAEGDLVGLGGPASLNLAAVEVGEAACAWEADLALVPLRVGAGVQWGSHPCRRRQLPDVGEADRELRLVLSTAADRLAELEVARWRPEVADELMDLRRRGPLVAPPGVPPRCVELAARALQALAVVELALEDDGGAITAAEAAERREALVPLHRTGRRALTAACSPEVWPPA